MLIMTDSVDSASKPPVEPSPNHQKSRKRSKYARDPVVVAGNAVFSVLLVAALIAFVSFHYGSAWLNNPGPLQRDTLIMVPRGSGTNEIADALYKNGAIDSPRFFKTIVVLKKARGKLQAGEYNIAAHSSIKTILDMMVEGKVVEHTITLPEGLTSEQIVQRLRDEELLSGSISQIPVEGSLLPETYKVVRGTPRESILSRMEEAQQKLLDALWEKRNPDIPVKTPRELVTLASIVEKETGLAAERPRVAAIFINRLKKGMRLQSDPTIIYGLVGGHGPLGRPILRSEISKATPYNTYIIPALPPGPIGNPGRASLEAVAQPLQTQDLFFVADGSGGHVFAETYADHQRNVLKWREIEKARSSTQAPPSNEAIPAEQRPEVERGQ
jgi:UPF0755 protein